MNYREIKRNGKGQIISFEIDNVDTSNSESVKYGKLFLSDNDSVKVTKYIKESYDGYVDINFTEFVREDDIQLDNPNPTFEVVATNPFRDNPSIEANVNGYPIWVESF